MVKNGQNLSKKVSKNRKKEKRFLVTLDETHQNITKNTKKVIFMAREGRKRGQKGSKNAIFGHFLLGKMAYLAIKWVQKGSKK